MPRPVRVAYYASHPIQYQAPLLRRIAQERDIELLVLYGSDFSVRGYRDRRFGVEVKWDLPLLGGYRHEFLPKLRDDGSTGFARPLNRGFVSRLRRGLDGEPFDLLWVHGYSTVNSLHAIMAAKALGIPVLLRAESWLADRPRSPLKLLGKRLFFRGLAKMIDGVLPIGTRNAEYWTHYFGARVPQFPMPYAVDNESFQRLSQEASARRSELQAELGLDPGCPVILFASKLQARKHCDHLLEAYRRLLALQQPAPYLVVVGDGEQRASLERQAEGLEGVRFCGFRNQSEMPRFFDLATVFVLPSQDEPWGMVVNEAMNAGRAVIVSHNVGCQTDLVTPGVEGLVYAAGDVDALCRALREILTTSGLSGRMGAAALERIRNSNFEEDVAGLRKGIAWATGRLAN